MVLSGKAIRHALASGLISIEPLSEEYIERSHVDLHLEDQPNGKKQILLPPKSFITLRTKENVTLSENICGLFDGRTSLARQGISVHQSSSLLEPDTDNPLTIEIFNASDQAYTLQGGQPIGKMILMLVTDSLP